MDFTGVVFGLFPITGLVYVIDGNEIGGFWTFAEAEEARKKGNWFSIKIKSFRNSKGDVYDA